MPLPSPTAVRHLTAEWAWRPLLRPQWQVVRPSCPWSAGSAVAQLAARPAPQARPRPTGSGRRLHRGVRAGRRKQQRIHRELRTVSRQQPAAEHRCLSVPARLTFRQTARARDRRGEERPTRQLKLAHLNINHLMPSIDEVNILLNQHKLDILCISETFLREDVDSTYLMFPGYVVERRDRK